MIELAQFGWFRYVVRMGDERYPKMAWQARMQGKDPKEDNNRLVKEGYGRFWWKEELNGTE
jgi:hypothetical protein